MRKYAPFSTVSVIVATTVLATPLSLHAAETKQIARSAKLGIELFGVGGDNWCQTKAQLQLSRTNDSPLTGKEETLFPKISKVFASECPQMETAEVVVFDSAGTQTRSFQIAKQNGWATSIASPNKIAEAPAKKTTLPPSAAQNDVAAVETTPQAPQPPQKEASVLKNDQTAANAEVAPPKAPEEEAVPLTSENILRLAAQYYPKSLTDNGVIDQLAILEHCDRYKEVRNNEFALRDWREEVKPEVLRKVKSASNLFEFSFNFRVDREYDFDTAMLDIGSFTPRTQDFDSRCGFNYFDDNALGDEVQLTFEDLPDTFNRKIYLPNQLGRTAIDRLESTGNKVRVTYLTRVQDVGFIKDWRNHYELKAEFIDVKIHTGEQFDYLLVHHDEAKFKAARQQHQIALQKAEEEQRKAEKQRLAAQRKHEEELNRLQRERENTQAQRLFDSLAGKNAVPAKLAALNHDGDTSFSNPYDLAARAFAQGGKLPVRAFVQVGDRDSVGYKATWPQRVYLTGAELEEGEWYFVSGMVDGQKIDNSLQSMIAVDRTTKCDDRICMDEQDVMDYVQSVYPQWSRVEE